MHYVPEVGIGVMLGDNLFREKSYMVDKFQVENPLVAGLNMKVCAVMGVIHLLVWAIWAGITRHPSRWKLWSVVVGGGLAMLLETKDFPPYQGFVDAHALWHATTIPLTYLWWSFIRDDAESRTSSLLKKIKQHM